MLVTQAVVIKSPRRAFANNYITLSAIIEMSYCIVVLSFNLLLDFKFWFNYLKIDSKNLSAVSIATSIGVVSRPGGMSSSSTIQTGEGKGTQSNLSEDKPTLRLPPLPQSRCECHYDHQLARLIILFFLTATGNVGGPGASKNPFMMPPEHELFVLREKERQKLKEVRRYSSCIVGVGAVWGFLMHAKVEL